MSIMAIWVVEFSTGGSLKTWQNVNLAILLLQKRSHTIGFIPTGISRIVIYHVIGGSFLQKQVVKGWILHQSLFLCLCWDTALPKWGKIFIKGQLNSECKPKIWRISVLPSKGQLNSEWIYEVIVSPKMTTKNLKDFCPGSLLEGRVEILKDFGGLEKTHGL